MNDALPIVEKCNSCGATSPLSRGFCMSCAGVDVKQISAGPFAEVFAVTTIYRPASGAGPPFSVALLKLDGGAKLMARVLRPVTIGERLNLRSEDLQWPTSDGA